MKMAQLHKVTVVILVALMCNGISGKPATKRFVNGKSARQVVEEHTPYPAAGFRPRIPFELPSERQPKSGLVPGLAPLPSTAAPAAAGGPPDTTPELDSEFGPEPTTTQASELEDFDLVAIGGSSTQLPTSTNAPTQDFDARTPADTYGAPALAAAAADDIESAAELVPSPSLNFQPPTLAAAQDFSADPATADDVAAGLDAEPVADFPAADAAAFNTKQVKHVATASQFDVKQTPAQTYGPPQDAVAEEEGEQAEHQPADTYGAPQLGSAELTDESELEADNEVEQLAAAEGQLQVLSRLSDLKNGRLLFVPADGTNLRQIYFAEVGVPQARSRGSARLIRF